MHLLPPSSLSSGLQAPFHNTTPFSPQVRMKTKMGNSPTKMCLRPRGGSRNWLPQDQGTKQVCGCCDGIWSQVLGKVEVQREWPSPW